MINEKNYPLHEYYLLLDKPTKNPFKIKLYGKTYMFIVNKKYFINPQNGFFSLKEKLYILTSSCDVIWKPISIPQMFYRIIFHNAIFPSYLNLNIINGKVIPYIEERSLLNV